jgi:hypothetical protein
MKTKILLTISIILNITFLVGLTLFIIYKDMFSLLMFRTSVKTVCNRGIEKIYKEETSQEINQDFCDMFKNTQ